jgi:glycosyltransferase involved in cell wall biosynthesis
MSEFGRDELVRAGLDPLYVPHAIDTNLYKPTPMIGEQTARSVFGLPEDAFVVGMIANNKGKFPSRKGFDQSFLAFSALRRAHQDAVLYVHAESTGMGDGVNLHRLAMACGIPEEAIYFADQYAYRSGLPDHLMAGLYSSFDVLLCASRGEGFGIPVIEAQACGVPVIVTDWTAQPELVGAGWKVDYRREWDEDQGSWWAMPLPEHIMGALEDAYNADPQRKGELAKGARAKALEYDTGLVYRKFWRPALRQLQDRLPSTEPVAASALDLAAL